MYKQYPYEITYKLPSSGNKRFTKRIEASHQAQAMRLFEASVPSAVIIFAKPLPQNR